MDELVHHCLRELSFDGDLGCNVSRLRDFIVGFYSHGIAHPQVVDDPFCAFVWSIVVEQPTVRVGTVPVDISSEVYIAPQTSAKRKAAAKGEVHVEEAPPSLILVENARERSLEDLKAEYGEDIRIAVDPETSFAAITGSHIRSSKLSPMVYSALQLITRGREEGITTVELGRKTKYDQKTCFYVIKQLLELGLIIKARRGGVGNHSCIHKYFVERSAFWQQIQEEEAKDDEPTIIGESRPQDGTPIEDGTPATEPLKLDFEPIDSRHMSSLQLIKNRIVKLLKASQNNIHGSNNLIVSIGFTNPTKTDRRFFQTRLRELIVQGVIERVLVPSAKVKDRYVKCIRLVTPDNQLPEGGVILAPQEGDEDDKEVVFDDAFVGYTEVRANRTIQKQVSDVLEDAGSIGRTLHEICGALGNFDKRTIELLLTRASKNRPPAHISDFGTVDFMESFGRERRHRYYTLAAYKTVMASENLEDTTTSDADIDLSKVGDFSVFNEAMFYDDDEKLHHYEDTFKDKEGAKPKKGAKKRKRGEIEDLGDEDVVEDVPEPAPKAKRGRPRKKPRVEDNDDAPTPPKKLGRAQKHTRVEEGDDAPTPKKRGRAQKQLRVEEGDDAPTPPKKRERPQKQLIPEEANETATTSAVPKRRGRPPKRKLDAERAGPTDVRAPTVESMEGVVDTLLPRQVPPVSLSETSEHPPESQAMPGVATDQQETAPVIPDAAPEPLASNSKEASRYFRKSDLTSSAASEDAEVDRHHTLQTGEDPHVQVAVPIPSDVVAVTSLVGELVKSGSGLVDADVEEVTRRLTCQTRSAASVTEVEGLRGEGSIDHLDESEMAGMLQQAVDGVRTNGLLSTESHSPAQEPMIIDPTLLESSVPNMTSTVLGEKRKESPPLVTPSQIKRARTSTPGDKKTNKNISHLRRENEILRVIQDLGGIANLHTKDFFDAHIALLKDLAQRGEPASAPSGTRLDKRTAEATVRNMESRGHIKVLKTTIFSATGSTRPACLIYLPDTPQEKINEFLHQLSHSTPAPNVSPIKTFEEPVVFGASKGASQRTLPLQPERPGKDDHEHAAGAVHLNDADAKARKVRAKQKRTKQKRDEAKQRAKKNLEAKAKLQSKAKEAKVQRENDWETLLQRVHPEPLKGTIGIRIRAVRNRFMQASSIRDADGWQGEIESAVQEAQRASDKVLARPQAFALPRPAALPHVATNIPEKSVHSLIAQQGPPIPPQQIGRSRGKTKPKGDPQEEQSQSQAPPQRRARFHWTREYDELARDASAIVRARCRNGAKLDLSAFDQVFPAVPRSSVRFRLAHLRENTGEDVYMKRLEDRWYGIWVQHRGTEHLPDEDPESPSNFDIVNHIEFLRNHVDKNALRVGYVEHTTRTKLPASTDDIVNRFDVLCNANVSPALDFMWQASVEEGREKQFLRQSFTHGADEVPYVTNPSADAVQVAEAAVKMVFGMPAEHYDADLAATMLHRVGDQPVSLATSNLLRRGVLSKVVRDPKKMKPGRTLKISDVNLNAIGGAVHRDLFQDAVALDYVFAEQVDSMEWPLIASDGDTAALLQLVSEEQVNFTIDVAQLRSSRARLDWNSKKADDNDIETNIQVHLNALDGDDNEAGGNAILPPDEPRLNPANMQGMQHGKTVAGTDAACAMKRQSRIIDCESCIESTFSEFVARLDGEQQNLAQNIFDRARASSESGTSKSHFLTLGAYDVVMDLLQRMSQTSPPLILWVGYSAPVIVSSLYARAWTVEIVGEPNLTALALPRRWLDIHGDTIRGTWDAALHAVMGIIVFHPGISQTELRWRLRAVFDRQELVDILCFLYREEAINARGDTERLNGPIWPVTLDDGEEQHVFWFIGKNRHWYQI
ncbi:hypothetical protein K503DRAFT_866963 [Rhizopogon vinicolor AM-OR11-026]|uniref:Uncharacterized protein n=1 Tax=Rhizopogon vinicolor AM-OR11-026 TaxID=1314800 RepID=A0A1B7MXH4_9AGAM|nr:hypothetical protein K503DRAFT_866963 [Rhizopogon vinicolor AM-OR11-026]